MTRSCFCLALASVAVLTAPTAAQNRSGPAVQGPPRTIEAGRQQPIRTVAGQEPVREPQGPAPFPQSQSQPQGQSALQPQRQPLTDAIGPLAPAGPQQPAWIPLDAEHEKWVNRVLQYWELRSSKIKALTCQFVRWQYEPAFGPKQADGRTPDPTGALTIAKGEIKYVSPDKGKFQVTELSRYAGPPMGADGKHRYAVQDASFAEHWVSDGKSVIQFDTRNKQLVQRELPPDMQGKAIVDGPLPFLFGARAETIRARYWVRGLPQGGNGKYWLEAVPKSRSDAQNFKQVTIVLDEKTYLPEMLEVFAPNYDSKTNPARETYQFTKHDVTDDSLPGAEILRRLNFFQSAFYAPKLPSGWTHVKLRADGTTMVPGAQGVEAKNKPAPPRSPLPR